MSYDLVSHVTLCRYKDRTFLTKGTGPMQMLQENMAKYVKQGDAKWLSWFGSLMLLKNVSACPVVNFLAWNVISGKDKKNWLFNTKCCATSENYQHASCKAYPKGYKPPTSSHGGRGGGRGGHRGGQHYGGGGMHYGGGGMHHGGRHPSPSPQWYWGGSSSSSNTNSGCKVKRSAPSPSRSRDLAYAFTNFRFHPTHWRTLSREHAWVAGCLCPKKHPSEDAIPKCPFEQIWTFGCYYCLHGKNVFERAVGQIWLYSKQCFCASLTESDAEAVQK